MTKVLLPSPPAVRKLDVCKTKLGGRRGAGGEGGSKTPGAQFPPHPLSRGHLRFLRDLAFSGRGRGEKCSIAISALALTLVFLTTSSQARADLDPETKTPYQLQVVLSVGGNRVFTPLFQEQLERDIASRLKLVFGELAKVSVTRTHPLLNDIQAKGLDATLDGFDALSDRTTHFVLVDYAAGSFQIQTRFHDGLTGQAGPPTKRAVLHDRADLASAIAEQIDTSFSPVATVAAVAKDVTLKLKAGELAALDRWVRKGHVFAVSRIAQESGRKKAQRLEWALLEVLDAPNAGVCRCRYWQRYQEDSLVEAPGTLGFRAIRLATTTGPVKVQLLDDTTLAPLNGRTVRIQKSGMTKPAELLTNRDGLATTLEDFSHLAIVQVMSGETVRAQFPVALLPGQVTVARVKIEEGGESLAPFTTRRDAWVRRIYVNSRMSTERSRELSAQLHQSLGAALEGGKKSLPGLQAEIKYLESEREQLVQLAKEKKWKFDSREGDREIETLQRQQKELGEFVARIEAVLKDPEAEKTQGLVQLHERARLLENEAEYDQAIRLYEQIVKASPGEKKVQAHLEDLKKAWTPFNAAHKDARAFLMHTWPTLDAAALGKNLDEAKRSLAVCKAANDKLTPVKFIRANAGHTANLTKELDTLNRRPSEDNRNKAKAIGQTVEALSRLHLEAVEWIGAK
jgi:hypothetical protein